ncbi:MAG: hypothetical protein IE891_07855 [Flavobacteriaceae bacterium]|nr:hypothetical protein [Flavobacteriaceae bacterium]
MRKTKLNFLTKLLFVSISLLLYGCLNEEVVDKIEHEHKHRFDTEYVPLSKVNRIKPHVDNFVQKHTSKSTSTDHLNLNEDRILVLSDTQTNYVSYSIGINNTIPANQDYFFDNLHVIEQDQIVIDNFIYRWIPDNPSEIFNSNTFSGKVQKFDLDYLLQAESTFINGVNQTANQTTNKVQISCIVIGFCSCSGDPYYCGCTEPSCPTIFGNYCFTGGGGDSGGGDGFGDGLGGEGGGGGSGTGNTGNDNDGFIGENGDPLHPIIPLPEMEDLLPPCDKIKKQFTDNATLEDKLNTLSGNTTATTERGIHKLSNSNIIQNAGVGTDGSVIMPFVPNGAKCTMMAHTHNSPASNTYSIFSWADLDAFAELLKQSKLDANKFTAFLATADGTYYALTIDNTQNFLKFFALKGDPLFEMDIALKRVEQASKYYGELDENPNPIIKIDSNPIDDEKAFLDLLQDNNLGLSLFESNATFTTFEKVTHNKSTGNIEKTPCN